MSLYIVILIGGSILFLLYFLSGIFYIIKRPQIIINKKISKTQKKYKIISINDYLTNLGKLNLYIAIIFLTGFIIAIYMDVKKVNLSYAISLIYLTSIAILNSIFQRKIKKYLVRQDKFIWRYQFFDSKFKWARPIHWIR